MRIILAALLAVLLTGCGIGGLTPVRSYSTSETLTLTRPAARFVDVAQEVGRSLGYRIGGIDRAKNTVTLSEGAMGGVGTAVLGKVSMTNITVTLMPGGREIAIDFMGTGNMSTVNQRKADNKIAELKAALAARFQ